MKDNVKTMTKVELMQLQQAIEKELILRREEERDMAKKEISNLLSVVGEICDKYDITLYDEYGGIVIPEELTM